MKKYKTGLFVFRRDLRKDDNTALIAAVNESEKVLPCFIFDPRQTNDNPYFSANAFEFLVNSLHDLDKQLPLSILLGQPHEVIEKLKFEFDGIEAVFVNRDYTPFSKQRDTVIEDVCKKNGLAFHSFDDALLTNPDEIRNKSGNPFKVYSQFYKTASLLPVRKPVSLKSDAFLKLERYSLANAMTRISIEPNQKLRVKGGRSEALKMLKNVHNFRNYDTNRNLPAVEGTTLLSAHLKFGTISVREVFDVVASTLGNEHTLIRELYWRDFFTHVAYHFPHVFGHAFQKQYDDISWSQNELHFERWCNGTTGFPIVDAGMRELNTTGFMHNRVRMVVASFLVKDLHLDWRLGEKYFAQKLVDYDPAVNNGNWQWSASTGCDAQPYFRIFNPWLQQQKFDPDCVYIKRWIPELRHLSTQAIHGMDKTYPSNMQYPRQVVNHTDAAAKAKLLFKSAGSVEKTQN